MADIKDTLKKGDTIATSTDPRAGGTAKKNYTCQKAGNDKGWISFGELNKDGAVTSGVALHTNDGDHQMYMEIDGERKGCTTFVGPGMGPGAQTQIVNQDNDINSTVTGNNNTVTNTQDNSVNQYGAYGSGGSAVDRAKALRDKFVAKVSSFAGA